MPSPLYSRNTPSTATTTAMATVMDSARNNSSGNASSAAPSGTSTVDRNSSSARNCLST
jgi:hypothetical protein